MVYGLGCSSFHKYSGGVRAEIFLWDTHYMSVVEAAINVCCHNYK